MADTRKLSNDEKAFVIQCLALGFTITECNDGLSKIGDQQIVGATYSGYKKRYAEKINAMRKSMDENLKEHFPLARIARRVHELTLLYNRAKDFEDELTYTGKDSAGRTMLKESIETRAKILKQIQDEIEPLRIANPDGTPIRFTIDLTSGGNATSDPLPAPPAIS